MAAAHLQLRAVQEHDEAFAVEPVLQTAHAIQVDHGRAVDARELFRVEPRLDAAQVAAQQVRPPARVNLRVVADRFQPVHFLRGDEVTLAALFDEEPPQRLPALRCWGVRFNLPRASVMFHQRQQPPAELLRAPLAVLALRASKRLVESLVRERLEQVVERADLEGPQRVAVPRGDENQDGRALKVYRFQNLETVLVRHLHVEQDEVGRETFDALDRRATVAALPDDFQFRVTREERANTFARVQLVVNDQRSYSLHSLPALSMKRDSQAGRRPLRLDVLNHELLPAAVKLFHTRAHVTEADAAVRVWAPARRESGPVVLDGQFEPAVSATRGDADEPRRRRLGDAVPDGVLD